MCATCVFLSCILLWSIDTASTKTGSFSPDTCSDSRRSRTFCWILIQCPLTAIKQPAIGFACYLVYEIAMYDTAEDRPTENKRQIKWPHSFYLTISTRRKNCWSRVKSAGFWKIELSALKYAFLVHTSAELSLQRQLHDGSKDWSGESSGIDRAIASRYLRPIMSMWAYCDSTGFSIRRYSSLLNAVIDNTE